MEHIKKTGIYVIKTVEAPAGFFSHVYLDQGIRRDIPSKYTYPSLVDGRDMTHLVNGPKGKWSKTLEESFEEVRKEVNRQIRKLEKDGDLRPSEVRRLDLLRGSLGVL